MADYHSSWSALLTLLWSEVPVQTAYDIGCHPLGIILIQIPYFGSGLGSGVVRASLLILLAALPILGHCKMMVHCKEDQLSTTQCVWDDLDEYALGDLISFCCNGF